MLKDGAKNLLIAAKWFVFFIASFYSSLIFAERHELRFWPKFTVQGSVPKHKKVEYLTDIEARFFDHPDYYQETLLEAGIGYRFIPEFAAYIGTKYITSSINPDEIRLWQQALINLIDKSCVHLVSRTMPEERRRLGDGETGWALRLRQRFWLSFPKMICCKITPVIYDELFFNLNKADWIPKRGFQQNRAFFGVQIPICKDTTTLQIGYLNQFIENHQNDLNNVFTLEIIVKD